MRVVHDAQHVPERVDNGLLSNSGANYEPSPSRIATRLREPAHHAHNPIRFPQCANP
jgi:hypothetical protein